MELDKAEVKRLRRMAYSHGLRAEKSRQQIHINNHGGLMLIDCYDNTVWQGVDYSLDQKQCEYWISRYAETVRGRWEAA